MSIDGIVIYIPDDHEPDAEELDALRQLEALRDRLAEVATPDRADPAHRPDGNEGYCACGTWVWESRRNPWRCPAATPDRADPPPITDDPDYYPDTSEELRAALAIVEEVSGSLPARDRAEVERLLRAALATPDRADRCCYGPQGHDPQDPHMFATPDRADLRDHEYCVPHDHVQPDATPDRADPARMMTMRVGPTAGGRRRPDATPDRADPEPLAQRIAAAMDAMGLEGNRPNIVYAREIVDRASLATPDRAEAGCGHVYQGVDEFGNDYWYATPDRADP